MTRGTFFVDEELRRRPSKQVLPWGEMAIGPIELDAFGFTWHARARSCQSWGYGDSAEEALLDALDARDKERKERG